MYLGKLILFGEKLLYLGKGASAWAKVVVFRQNDSMWANWFYLGKSGSIWAMLVLFGQKWFYFGKSGSTWAKWLNLGKGGFIWAKWLDLGKLVLFGQKWFYLGEGGSIYQFALIQPICLNTTIFPNRNNFVQIEPLFPK